MSTTQNKPDVLDLTCWYLNQRRVVELVPAARPGLLQHPIVGLATAKDAFLGWLRDSKTPSLGQLLGTGRHPSVSQVFTHHSDFYCRGLAGTFVGERPKAQPEIYCKLDPFKKGLKLRLPFHVDHLTSTSAWAMMTGHQRLFVAGVVTESTETEIQAIPYIIGLIVSNPIWGHNPEPLIRTAGNYREVFPEQVSQFSRIRGKARPRSIEPLRSVPERQVKSHLVDILGESSVPKDWGGETSDLFTTNVDVDGKRVAAAFLLKGPSFFKPLTSAGLGKNGDQIVRLFNEPAQLFVLQHCHDVTPAIRKTMSAFASQLSNPQWFMIIDGRDTLRLLRAYTAM